MKHANVARSTTNASITMVDTTRRPDFTAGARDILPLAFGAAVYGAAFGLLAAQAGLDELRVGVMGATVFAGASQIVAVERMAAGAGALVALIAGVALNLRLLLITASIRDVFAGRPLWQVALGVHITTDESWALLLAKRAEGRNVGYWYLLGSGLTVIVIWVASTTAGVVFASAIPEPRALGMDFAFTAAFIAIARSLWRGRVDILPWGVSFGVVATILLTGWLDASWAIIAGGLAAAATAAVRPA